MTHQPQECRVKCSSGAVLRNQWVTKPLKLNPPRRKALGTITVFLQGLIWLSQASNPQIFFFLNHHLGNIDPSIHFQYLFIPVLTVRGLLEPNPAVIGQGRIHPGQATSSMQGHTERRSFILTLADTNRHFSIIFFASHACFWIVFFEKLENPEGTQADTGSTCGQKSPRPGFKLLSQAIFVSGKAVISTTPPCHSSWQGG